MIRKSLILIFFIIEIFANTVYSQVLDSNSVLTHTDSISFIKNDTLVKTDSIAKINDTIPNRSIDSSKIAKNDTVNVKKDKFLDNPVDFKADDSMYISVANHQIILFGKGNVNTQNMNLTADSIAILIDKKELDAKGMTDSSGKISGTPVFKDGDKEYKSDEMRYNFNSKKGLVYNVITQEQNGFLHGEIVKMLNNDEMNILRGKYTTCDDPHPHYYFDISKAKAISKKRLITGPVKFVIADIPLYPIVLPFGFFPLSHKNTSGIHFPTFKDELDRGFGLIGTGYYWAINDHYDVDLTTDLYTKGSWGVTLKSNIKYRYAFTSLVNLSFFHYQNGPAELSTTNRNNSFSVGITYNQDSKARPNSNLSASINYSYGNFQQLNSQTIDQYVTTTQNSSASYQKTFAGTPFRLSMNMNMVHNTKDSTTNLSFPTLNFNMSNIYPFKSKKIIKNKFYEKISLSFNSSFQNSVTAKDTLLFNHPDSIIYYSKNGFQYQVPLSTNFTLLKFINITPTLSYRGRIYFNKLEQVMDYSGTEPKTKFDTIWGFNHLSEYNFSISANTKIFGIFKLNIGRLKAIRHVISPSISYTMKPDFSDSKFGYYGTDLLDSTKKYSYYSNGVYGAPSSGKQQSLSFSINNNFEAKYKSKDSTQEFKKMNILDNLSISGNYNFALDSLNFSDISINTSTNLFKKLNTSFSAAYTPYTVDSLGRKINTFLWTDQKKLLRLTTMRLSLSSSLKSDEVFAKTSPFAAIVWSANGSFSINYNKNFNATKQEFVITLSQTLNFSFNIAPTPKWNIAVQSGYDFDANNLSPTQINITRDLHCWEMSAQIIPFGTMKSYLFSIQIKDPMFNMIKVKKERSWLDN